MFVNFHRARTGGSVFSFQPELSHACHLFKKKKVHITHTRVTKENWPGESFAKEKGPSSSPASHP